MKNGVPFDALELLSEAESDAYFVVFQELESGKTFSWETMTWPD